jgi:hypothetical protein
MDRGFFVRVPSGIRAVNLSGSCTDAPVPTANTGSLYVGTGNEGTCHVDIELADGTHRSGDSNVSFADRRCCRGPYGSDLDLTK